MMCNPIEIFAAVLIFTLVWIVFYAMCEIGVLKTLLIVLPFIVLDFSLHPHTGQEIVAWGSAHSYLLSSVSTFIGLGGLWFLLTH